MPKRSSGDAAPPAETDANVPVEDAGAEPSAGVEEVEPLRRLLSGGGVFAELPGVMLSPHDYTVVSNDGGLTWRLEMDEAGSLRSAEELRPVEEENAS